MIIISEQEQDSIEPVDEGDDTHGSMTKPNSSKAGIAANRASRKINCGTVSPSQRCTEVNEEKLIRVQLTPAFMGHDLYDDYMDFEL